MRILFSMRHLGSLRMYDSVLRQLAAAGHEIEIVARRRDVPGTASAPEQTLADVPQIRWIWEQVHVTDWTALASIVRIWLDYLRYSDPKYASIPRQRRLVGERVPAPLRRFTDRPLVRSAMGRRLLTATLRMVERALPREEALDALLRERRPDVLLLTPVIRLGSSQIEMVRSGRALGVRTGVCIASWDHLSSKARIAEIPDRVFVWNDTQKQEAVDLHGVPVERVSVTGAQCYDQWFDRQPARDRQAFCAAVGLPADRPFILYACSTLTPEAPYEAEFVRRWIDELRASQDPVLRSASILIRPHPQRLAEWKTIDLSGLPGVTLYGSHPLDERSKEDYFDSLYHASAVVGLLTSVFLEASILGLPMHTIVLPEFVDRQSSLYHFSYLSTVGGGLVQAADTFTDHGAQLGNSLRESLSPARHARFVEAFIRPHGLDRPATEVFVAAVEEFGRTPRPAPVSEPLWVPAVRLALRPVALAVGSAVARTEHPDNRTVAELQQAGRRDQHRRDREDEHRRLGAERDRQRQEKVRRAELARASELRERELRLDADRAKKRELKAAKEAARRQHGRAKRRAGLVAFVKRRLGVG
jgi:hypothetical protein